MAYLEKMRIGCDIVHITRFVQKINKNSGLVAKIFSEHELQHNPSIESLAGMFAAKEAALKALQLAAGSWLDLVYSKLPSGEPTLLYIPNNNITIMVSISHDGEYASAFVLCELVLTV